jgi:hypothetical protein
VRRRRARRGLVRFDLTSGYCGETFAGSNLMCFATFVALVSSYSIARSSTFISPQWYGERGDILVFAKETPGRIPQPSGSMLYFQIVTSLACYCKPDFEDLHQISYPIAKQTYANITR